MPRWTPSQEEAIYKSGSNIIVSAGAGSGKTAVLSQRVINKIESGIHINELLILTFTKAAASEMKDRIRHKLESNPKYDNELKLLTSSYITTFDSFALSVVKKYHYLLNISSNISICDESIIRIKEEEIINDIFEQLYGEHNNDFESLIDKFCLKNDNTLRSNIQSIASKISNMVNYKEYIDYIRNSFYSEDSINNIILEYHKLIDNKRNEVRLKLNNLSYYFDSELIDKFNSSLSGLLNCSYDEVNLYKSISFPRVSKYPSDESKVSRDSLKESVDELLSLYKYEDIKSYLIANSKYIYTILDIVLMFIDKINEYKKDNNIYTFSDIAYLSIKVLKENISALNEIKYSFKEIMIDEYQDTNDVQDIFIKLIENNNVYMVGDIKQSIYKFRGSNPGIFKGKYDSYSNGDGGYKIDLIQNFRSRSEVLDDINNIFRLLMDDMIGGADYKVSHEMVFGNTNYLDNIDSSINYSTSILEYDKSEEYSNNEIEMFIIANDIKNKIESKVKVFDKERSSMREATYNDFVIILDRSKYFTDYKKVFEYMGIPLTILKDESLTDNSDLLLIRNIVDFIIHINSNDYSGMFKYDFVSIARSFLYEYSDNEIFNIVNNNSYFGTDIFKDFSSFKDINSLSVSEIFNKIIEVSNYYDKLNKVGDFNSSDVRLKTIYNLSSSLNDLGYNIYDFKDYLDNIIENGIDIKYTSFNDSSNSVKIMTIHASKGLEYPFCYFADLDHSFNKSDLKSKFIVTSKYGIILSEDDNVLKELYKSDYNKEEISERLRLFYVALTRAREKIIVVLPYKDTIKESKNDNGLIDDSVRFKINKLSDFIYLIKDYNSKYFNKVDLSNINITKNYLYKKSINKTISNSESIIDVEEIRIENNTLKSSHFSKEKFSVNTKSEYNLMKSGTLVHRYLEYIDFKNYDSSLIDNKFIRSKIDKFASSEILSNVKSANIFKEYEFMYKDDNNIYNGVIDLMLEYDDHIDIIDYKLKGISDEEYTKQLNGYKDYISIVSNKKVNIYLYSILDEKLLSL